MNRRENNEMYKSDLKVHQSCNGSLYQDNNGDFVTQEASKCDAEHPIAGPVYVDYKFPCVEQV